MVFLSWDNQVTDLILQNHIRNWISCYSIDSRTIHKSIFNRLLKWLTVICVVDTTWFWSLVFKIWRNNFWRFSLSYLTVKLITTAWKVSKYRVFSWSVFSCIRTEYGDLRIQSEYRNIRTRKNSVFGHFTQWHIFPISSWQKHYQPML